MASPPRGVEGISRSSANEAQRVRASDFFCSSSCSAQATSLNLCGANSLRSFTPLSAFFLTRFAGLKKTFEQLTSTLPAQGSCRSRQTSIPRPLPRRISHRKSVS